MLFEAGLISVVRTILIIVVVYYLVRYVLRTLFPFILKHILKKQFTSANFRNQSAYTKKEKEGEVHIKSNTTTKSRNDDLGDYVEYEEIEDSKS